MSFINTVSAVCMVLALLWLSVMAPFVLAARQELAKTEKPASGPALPGTEDESTNPFGNTTEEKTPSGNSLSEEYLHDQHAADHLLLIVSRYYKCENSDTYTAFHGELLVPPPNLV